MIWKHRRRGNNVTVGRGTVIEDGVAIGDNVSLGDYCLVRKGVSIGAGTTIANFVELRTGTMIGRNCRIDSGVTSSGECVIGDDVTLRYGVIIAKGCVIGNKCYLSPRVMTNNLDSALKPIGGAKLGSNVFVGTQAVLHHGITIGDNATVGAMSFVNKDVPAGAKVVGIPARTP